MRYAEQEIFLVNWKTQKNHFEVFDNLDVFLQSYPRYDLETFRQAFQYDQTLFEDQEVRIEKKTVLQSPKPDFPRGFFWDTDYDSIHWKEAYVMVIQRILERGNNKYWEELNRYYGQHTIIRALKEKVTYLPDERIDDVSSFYHLHKEEMLCYKRKQSLPQHWI